VTGLITDAFFPWITDLATQVHVRQSQLRLATLDPFC
jgi:hypothetical protein